MALVSAAIVIACAALLPRDNLPSSARHWAPFCWLPRFRASPDSPPLFI
jgi:hypothetical protein